MDNLSKEEYESWLGKILQNLLDSLSPGAPFYIWNGHRQFGPMHHMLTAASAKSTVVSLIYVLWCICHARARFIVLISDTAEKACEFLDHIKYELVENALLVEDYPEVCEKGVAIRNACLAVWRRVQAEGSVLSRHIHEGDKLDEAQLAGLVK